MRRDIRKRICEEYLKIDAKQPAIACCVLYNIIELKQNFNLLDVQQSLYVDAKQLISLTFASLEIADYGYDQVPMTQIVQILDLLPIEQQKELYSYVLRKFSQAGYEDDDIKNKIYVLSNKLDWSNKKYIKCLLRFCSSKDYFIVIFGLLYILFVYIIIHPAPVSWMSMLDINLFPFCDNEELNYLMNALAYIWGDSTYAPSISPVGFLSLVIIGIAKLFILVFVGNFLIKKIIDFFEIKH